MKTKIFSLGGMEEIGKSSLVIEHNNEIIIIDAGIKFAESFLLGVGGLIPDYSYLEKNKHKIKALFITHSHEDHIGAMPYLLKKINIPIIYMPKIGHHYLALKTKEHKIKNTAEMIETTEDIVFKSKYFKVDFYVTTHSIPDAFGVRVQTPNGTIIATGDYRFDYTPIGQIANFKRIKMMGDEGVDLLFSDATNAMIPAHSPTEQLILKDIEKFIREGKGKVILTIFASNLTRINAVIELAQKLDKKILPLGRSIVNGLKIAFKIGYIDARKSIIIDKKSVSRYPDNEILVICTGSQGEEFAALNMMSKRKHNQITIKKDDIVIFSSSPIPGNRIEVEQLINRLSKCGAIVKEHNVDGIIHTSGHAYQEEHKKIFRDLKPTYFVPCHGEYRMNVAHMNTAIDMDIKAENTWSLKNGRVMFLEEHKLVLSKETIDVGPIYVDGLSTTTITPTIMEERRRLANAGFVSVVAVISKSRNVILGRLKLISKGTLYVKTSQELILAAQKLVHRSLLYTIKNKEDWTKQDLRELVTKKLEIFFFKNKRRKPLIIPNITVID